METKEFPWLVWGGIQATSVKILSKNHGLLDVKLTFLALFIYPNPYLNWNIVWTELNYNLNGTASSFELNYCWLNWSIKPNWTLLEKEYYLNYCIVLRKYLFGLFVFFLVWHYMSWTSYIFCCTEFLVGLILYFEGLKFKVVLQQVLF